MSTLAPLSGAMDPKHLWAIVDMGSNGIRFSISSLAPPTTRILPTLYQRRAAISLYDAQYPPGALERQPIDQATIDAVLAALRRFQRVCADFDVPTAQVRVLATEATRTAPNSEAFRGAIKAVTGWDVTLLSKQDEGHIGALGVVSSLPEVSGLVMDLGGGSMQLSFLHGSGGLEGESGQAVSLPFGAAALMRRLTEAEAAGAIGELKKEVKAALGEAYQSLALPPEVLKDGARLGGLTLHLSGGGFRGWGYVLMSRHRVQPYPVPGINGFGVSRHDFLGVEDVTNAAAATLAGDGEDIFRVSDRRASQVPAVAFLVDALAEVLPQIKQVRFCQGGVREGYLFSTLADAVRGQNPLLVASQSFAPISSAGIAGLIGAALPAETLERSAFGHTSVLTPTLLHAFANLIYHHGPLSKDLQASAALRSTTSGMLARVHGLLHESRVLLGLLLCARWGGEVPPTDCPFKSQLEQLVDSPWTLWWINYFGAVAALVAAVYPAGRIGEMAERLAISARLEQTSKGRPAVRVALNWIAIDEQLAFVDEVHRIEKVGSKKRWIGGPDGVGMKVIVEQLP